ncbi:MAG: putative lipid II flippase FtsW [Pseudomonadota bacterium]
MTSQSLNHPVLLLRNIVAELTERQVLVVAAGFLLCIGLIMVGSASMGVAEASYGNPFYFLTRHAIYLMIGLVVAALVLQVPMQFWSRYSYWVFLLALILIAIVLIPGIGRRVNGSMRWIGFGGITLQPSEVMKLAAVLAMAAYLVRRQEEVRSKALGFIKPLAGLFFVIVFLMAEPDFGASIVVTMATTSMLFLAGAKLKQFFGVMLVLGFASIPVIMMESYRMKRLLAFTDPWADQYNTGYQLVQSLIAFGRGDWFGVGLGHSVQKLFYLPEAHTDFVFAVYAEEFGLLGVLVLLAAVAALVTAALRIGQRAERAGQFYSAYVAYGLAVMLGVQSAINIGVNIGFFPTKGLTLPLVSYGGSSLVMVFAVLAILLRIDAESGQVNERGVRRADGGDHGAR